MYMFNRITVNPQLPSRISKLTEISNNLWWSWNTEFLKIFKEIDIDLWERVDKNPVKFLKLVSQEKLEQAVLNPSILKQYDKIVDDLGIGGVFPLPLGTINNYFVSVIYPGDVENVSYQPLRKLLKGKSVDSNPILMFYKLDIY